MIQLPSRAWMQIYGLSTVIIAQRTDYIYDIYIKLYDKHNFVLIFKRAMELDPTNPYICL